MEPIVQPYNMFAQQKMAGYPSYQDTQKRVPGQVQGETPEQFAAGKQAANSQTGAVSTPVVETKATPVVTKTTPQAFTPLDTRSSTAGMDYLNSLYTSPQEEERLRKASVMNQRILAIGDAVRHIGNIANTVGYAPSQQFNDPVALEQARYEKGKALRDKANQQYYTYQQQKAAQDAKIRQLDAQTKYQNESLALRKSEHNRLLSTQKLAERKQEAYERIKSEELEIKKKLAEGKISVDEFNAHSRRLAAEAAWLRADKYQPGGSSGVGGYETTTETTHEPEYTNPITGEVTKWKSKTTRTRTPTKKHLPGQSNTSKKKLPNQ